MQPVDHARKIRAIADRIARHTKKLAKAQADLCEALTAAAQAGCEQGLLTAQESSEVIAPKDEGGE